MNDYSEPAILSEVMSLQFQPMPLQRRSLPFDDPEWIFELKYDGFRALAVIEHGRAQLLSRNGHLFASFSALAESISDSLPNVRTVIDGEICSQFSPYVTEREHIVRNRYRRKNSGKTSTF